jgi:amphi-Trp domain-containing protein
MSGKRTLFECRQTRLTATLGDILRQLADGLAQGKIELRDDCGQVSAPVSREAKVELSITEKPGDRGTKRKLALEVKWQLPAEHP